MGKEKHPGNFGARKNLLESLWEGIWESGFGIFGEFWGILGGNTGIWNLGVWEWNFLGIWVWISGILGIWGGNY